MVFEEREIEKDLFNLFRGASGSRLSVGGFGRGEGHVSYGREEFWIDLDRSRDTPAAQTILQTGEFSLLMWLLQRKRQACGT